MTTKIIFNANNGSQGSEPWITDGTQAGTSLLADVFPGTSGGNAAGFFDLGNGRMVFAANNGAVGTELWVTDGSAAGTSLLRDLRTIPNANATPGSGAPGSFFAIAPGRALFRASDGSNGSELWVTDGTAAGTSMVLDINPGSSVQGGVLLGNNSSPAYFNSVGGRTVFTATTASGGNELWVTDGTAAGTSQLVDINPGAAASSAQTFFRMNDGRLLFSAVSGTTGRELWVTDGTAAGTTMVADIVPGAGSPIGYSSFSNATRLGGNKVMFVHYGRGEPWVTDGTAAGTYELKDIRPGASGSALSQAKAMGDGRALFAANNGTSGAELWITDGSSAGTSLVADLLPGSAASSPQGFTAVPGGRFVFSAIGAGTVGRELWVTDGTAGGTSLLADLFPGTIVRYGTTYANSGGPVFFGNRADGAALFSANTPASGRELWVTDGTVAGTSLVRDINPFTTFNNSGPANPGSSTPSSFVPLGDGRFAFTANDGASGVETWITDGTAAGTHRAGDVNTVNAGSNTQPSTQTRTFTPLGNGKSVFVAFDGITGNELWVTDGTAAGTSLLADVQPNNNNGGPVGAVALGDGRALFSAFDGGPIGRELWITDGTSAGTSLFLDFRPTPGQSSFSSVVGVLSPTRILLSADNGSIGTELFISDGTAAGTTLLKDINPGPAGSNPALAVPFGAGALFTANDGTTGPELWFTDGTAAGTTLVRDIGTSAYAGPRYVTALGSRAIFQANDGTSGAELWVTDGTSAGTSLLKDIQPGAGYSYPRSFRALGNGQALFTANDGTTGTELWITDGTSAGTSLLIDLQPGGSGGAYNTAPVVIAPGRAVFNGYRSGFGNELWITDGTTAGTSMVADISPGADGSFPYHMAATGTGKVVFSARTPATGTELWVTDGSAAGTSLLFEFVPGTAYGRPENMRATGDGRVLFEAGTPATGREVWITDGTAAGTHMVRDINTVTASSSPSALTVFRSNDAPALAAALADQTADEDAPFAFAIPAGAFADPNPWDATLSYSAALAGGGALPAWLGFTPATGAFAGTPANADVGTVSVRVTATDSFGKTASDVFDLTVRNTNDTPAAAAYATAVTEDATGANLWSTLLGLATDDDLIWGDQLTLSAVGTGGTLGHVVFDPGSQTLRYVADAPVFDTLPTGQSMIDSFTYTVRDLAGATATATVQVTVTAVADATIGFAVRGVKDATLGAIDGAAGAGNAAQNEITAGEITGDHQNKYQQLLAFVDDTPGGALGGIAGADRAYNLSDVGGDDKLASLPVANTALDPVLVTAHGVINDKTVGALTDAMQFSGDAFGVKSKADDTNLGAGSGNNGRWIDTGDSVTLHANDPAALLRAARFTFTASGIQGDLVLDWDGAVTRDTNGATVAGGFATDPGVLRFNNVFDGSQVAIDFYARTLSIAGVAQTAPSVQAWFAAREAAGGLRDLTLGASLSGNGWRPSNLAIETVPAAPGGGFVDRLF